MPTIIFFVIYTLSRRKHHEETYHSPVGGSSAPVSASDVTFYDYDGTVVASYTLAEAQALTALPDGPTHKGLTFQGWNWTLADINALTRPMNVSAMYSEAVDPINSGRVYTETDQLIETEEETALEQ